MFEAAECNEEAVEALVDGEAIGEDGVGDEVVIAVVEAVALRGEGGVAEKEVPTRFSNPTGTLECSSPKARITCWSRRILSPGSPSMARSAYPSKVASMAQKPSTGCGIRSGASLLLVSSEVSMTFTSSLARRFCTLALPVVRASVMLRILLARFVLFYVYPAAF